MTEKMVRKDIADASFMHQLRSVKQTAKEHELSEYIIKHPQEFIHMSIAEAAEASGMSEATLVRFSKKLGYKGFQALKIHLAQEAPDGMLLVDGVQEGDRTADIAKKLFFSYRNALETTSDVLQPDMIDVAAGYIKNAKRIFFFGVGGSQNVAADAANKLIRFGIMAYYHADQNMQKMAAALTTSEDVAFAISHSGATISTLETLMLAKKNGAKTIALTNFSRSPILKYADVTLFTASNETRYQFESFSSRIAQLTIMDLLLNVVIMSDSRGYAKLLNDTRRSLDGTKV